MSGLDESDLYSIHLEFRPSDQLKYRFVNGEWKTSPRNDSIKQTQPPIVHVHPDSPKYGSYWTTNPIAFGKLKLTNNEMTKNEDAVYLKSLNKYTPHVLVYKHIYGNLKNIELVYTYSFVETQFIAVTAYQNEQVTSYINSFFTFISNINNKKYFLT
jgi:brachyury protein